jgi:hypothetical protein
MLVHHVVYIHVMSLNSISDDFLKGLPLVVLLGLQLLEGCSVFQHLG